MRKLLLTTTALVSFVAVGSAGAADLPVKAPYAPAVICPACNWSGFYLGVNVGGSIGVIQNTDGLSGFPTGAGFPAAGNPFLSSDVKRALPGIFGGVQGGFNWQTGNLVLGVEADWQFTDEKSTLTVQGQNLAAALFTNSYTDQERIKSLGTARARLGWAHDSYLWYVTGGAAWATVNENLALSSNFNPAAGGGILASPFVAGTNLAAFSHTKSGWTIGGGVETRLWGGWSAKLEYLYVDLGSVTDAFVIAGNPGFNTTAGAGATTAGAGNTFTVTSSTHIRDHIVRVGMNYKFW